MSPTSNAILFAALGALLTALGCAPLEETEGVPTGATCPPHSTVTYDGFVAGFMEEYCTECHTSELRGAERQGAPSDHNFDTMYDVAQNAEHIDEVAGSGPDGTNDSMPPSGSPQPAVDERAQLSEWLACKAAGAKEP